LFYHSLYPLKQEEATTLSCGKFRLYSCIHTPTSPTQPPSSKSSLICSIPIVLPLPSPPLRWKQEEEATAPSWGQVLTRSWGQIPRALHPPKILLLLWQVPGLFHTPKT
jgi:hypothetical protein